MHQVCSCCSTQLVCVVHLISCMFLCVCRGVQLAKNVGNAGFNEIMEACLTAEDVIKPNPASDM